MEGVVASPLRGQPTHVDSIWVKVQVFNDIIVVWAVQSSSKESEMILLDGNTCVRVAGNSEGGSKRDKRDDRKKKRD